MTHIRYLSEEDLLQAVKAAVDLDAPLTNLPPELFLASIANYHAHYDDRDHLPQWFSYLVERGTLRLLPADTIEKIDAPAVASALDRSGPRSVGATWVTLPDVLQRKILEYRPTSNNDLAIQSLMAIARYLPLAVVDVLVQMAPVDFLRQIIHTNIHTILTIHQNPCMEVPGPPPVTPKDILAKVPQATQLRNYKVLTSVLESVPEDLKYTPGIKVVTDVLPDTLKQLARDYVQHAKQKACPAKSPETR